MSAIAGGFNRSTQYLLILPEGEGGGENKYSASKAPIGPHLLPSHCWETIVQHLSTAPFRKNEIVFIVLSVLSPTPHAQVRGQML